MLTNYALLFHGKLGVGHSLTIFLDARAIIILLGLFSFVFPYTYHGCAMAPNSDHAWVVTSDTTLVLHTWDGGVSWEQQQILTTRPFSDVFFLDSLSGWVITECAAVIWHTTNGGRSWYWQNIGGLKRTNRIFFLDTLLGLATGWGPLFLRTSDGGVYWAQMYIAWLPYDTVDFYGVSFVDSLNGWMCAGQYPKEWGGDTIFKKGQGFIVHSEDGGDSWVLQKRDTIYDFFDIKFKDSLEGWVVGGNDSTMEGCVFHTTDGGLNWNLQTLPPEAKILNSLELIGEDKLWAVGKSGTIIHSNDGNTWQMQVSGVDTTLYDVDFADSLRGLIAGDGVVLYTRDGGNTWNEANIVGITNNIPSQSNRIGIIAYPNPFSKKITIQFLSDVIPNRLKIYDVTGKLVNTIHLKSLSPNRCLVFSVFDQKGKEIKPGVYFIKLESQNHKLRLVKAK